MRKLISVVLMLALALGLVACGGEGGEKSSNELYIHYKDVKIEINALAESILKALGEPISYTEEASCAFEGKDKTYGYEGFYLNTYPAPDGERVFGFWLAEGSTVTTPEGITLGATEAQAEAAYGSDNRKGNNFILFQGKGKVAVMLTDGVVTAIMYQIAE